MNSNKSKIQTVYFIILLILPTIGHSATNEYIIKKPDHYITSNKKLLSLIKDTLLLRGKNPSSKDETIAQIERQHWKHILVRPTTSTMRFSLRDIFQHKNSRTIFPYKDGSVQGTPASEDYNNFTRVGLHLELNKNTCVRPKEVKEILGEPKHIGFKRFGLFTEYSPGFFNSVQYSYEFRRNKVSINYTVEFKRPYDLAAKYHQDKCARSIYTMITN